jgi:hypothetical protein
LINNVECEEPRITLKRDSAVKDSADKVVTFDQLEAELGPRNTVSPSPIQITYEYKYCWNVTYIDTPGLVTSAEKSTGEVGMKVAFSNCDLEPSSC